MQLWRMCAKLSFACKTSSFRMAHAAPLGDQERVTRLAVHMLLKKGPRACDLIHNLNGA